MFYTFYLSTVDQGSNIELDIWIPAIISIITLVVNIIFFNIILPRSTYRNQRKEKLYEICAEFTTYLSSVVSLDSFSGVPTRIRNYCLQIHLMFVSGTAPEPLSSKMETIFQLVQERKCLLDENKVIDWETTYRIKVRELRKELSKYTGTF